MTSSDRKTRRRYGSQFKAMVLAQCDDPGASVAQVAMSHGINDNVVHRWRQLARKGRLTVPRQSEFIALPLPVPAATPAATAPSNITVELRRGSVAMTVTWPMSAAADFAVWTRELLR